MQVTEDSPQYRKSNREAHTSMVHGNLGCDGILVLSLKYESMWWFCERSRRPCGGFMGNVPHSLGHLNTGTPGGGTVWGSLGGAWKVKILPPIPVCSLRFSPDKR